VAQVRTSAGWLGPWPPGARLTLLVPPVSWSNQFCLTGFPGDGFLRLGGLLVGAAHGAPGPPGLGSG
jgi:hypothetical protein